MDFIQYVKFLAALAFVLALIGVLTWFLRRMSYMRFGTPGQRRRLSVIEVLPIDPRRRLVLVRRDDTEHLLLLGPEREMLIETRPRLAGFAESLDREAAVAKVANDGPPEVA
jgi:flagellar protein FliO/FliZ